MASTKSSFLDKVLGRLGRLDKAGLQTVVQLLARERAFLETLFNTIDDGIMVLDESGKVLYVNQAITRLLGVQPASASTALRFASTWRVSASTSPPPTMAPLAGSKAIWPEQ